MSADVGRAILIVLDSVGCGGAEDAAAYGDEGADTLGHIAEACALGRGDRAGLRRGSLTLPRLDALGLGHAIEASTGRTPPGFGRRSTFGLFHEASPAEALEQRARQAERVEAEIAPRKRIVSRPLEDEVASDPRAYGSGSFKVAAKAWEELLERLLAAREKHMEVPRLRRAGARSRAFGQNVPVENGDFFEMGRDGLRRRKASHSGADPPSRLPPERGT